MPKNLRQLKQEYTYLLEDLNANLRAQLELTQIPPVTGLSAGVVYVLRQIGTHNYKIGISTNYQQRKAQFDVRLPFNVEEVLVYRTDRYRDLESALHKYFEAYRLNGSEFFELSDAQIEALPDTIELLLSTSPEPETSTPSESEVTEDRDATMVERARDLLAASELSPYDVSVSFMQRKLSIGYARAARLKDRLIEEANIQNH